MTGQEIKNYWRLLIDEQDDLSEAEVYSLMNRCYKEILQDRPWSFLVKTKTGTLDTSNTSYSLPSDFRELENNYQDPVSLEYKKVLFVGTNYDVYEFIPMLQRNNYRDTKGYAYIDYRQDKFVLTKLEDASQSYEFDYIYNPSDITESTEPVIPSDFHKMIAHKMAYEWAIIDQTQRNYSYAPENEKAYKNYLGDLRILDAKKKLC